VRWQFKGKTPIWAYVIAALLGMNILLQLTAVYWVSWYAPTQHDRTHTYPIRFRGGPTYFVRSWLGVYDDYSLYIGFALLGVFLLLLWLNRDKLERVR